MLLEKFNYVLAIAEEQNITRAASKLYVSQPALTLYLNRLEDELGVKLFDRSKTPIQMTSAGKHYIEKMKLLMAEERELRSNLRAISNGKVVFNIGMGPARGHLWLPIVLPIFCTEFPDLNINIFQSEEAKLAEFLREDKIDVRFGIVPPSFPFYESVELESDPLILVAHRKYNLVPEEKRKDNSPANPYLINSESLNGLPFMAPPIQSGLYEAYYDMITDNNIEPGRIVTIFNQYTSFKLAAYGVGVQLTYREISYMKNVISSFENIDFCTLEKMPFMPKSFGVYKRDNEKIEYIKEFISIVQDEVLPHYDYNRET